MVTLNKLPDIQLAKDGYDPFIDFMKGFCILSVVLVHAIPHIPGGVYTIGQCVPLFLLIQVYHYYKNGMENAKPFNIQKVWKRILRPFFGVQLFIISVYAITHYHSETFQEMAVKVLSKGGYGAGSYYPWIYIQFAILLSLLAKWLSKLSNVKIGGVILTFCIVAELVCNLLHVSEEFWRLACFRYLFLIYLGILWCKNGLRMNSTRLCLALLSAVSMAIFSYSGIDWYPFFIENAWKSYRWITYFWVAFALPILLWWVYNVFSTRLKHFVELLGKYSYEIFLCQMVVFCLPRKVFLSHLGETAGSLTFIALTISLSIVPVLIYKRIHLK